MLLTPPPVALLGFSFQTVSAEILPAEATSLVPPQPRAYGLEAGKSTCALPSVSPSPEPLSPAAQQLYELFGEVKKRPRKAASARSPMDTLGRT